MAYMLPLRYQQNRYHINSENIHKSNGNFNINNSSNRNCSTHPVNEKRLNKSDNFKSDLKADWNDGMEDDECRDTHVKCVHPGQLYVEENIKLDKKIMGCRFIKDFLFPSFLICIFPSAYVISSPLKYF